MMVVVWYQWAILGLIFMGLELLVPAFVLVWFGLGACLTALLYLLMPNLTLTSQLAIWLASSLVFVALWFTLFKSSWHKTLSGRASAAIIGETGLLVSDVDPFRKGQVRFQQPIVGSDVWTCIADQSITAGQRVKVTSVEGNLVKVSSIH